MLVATDNAWRFGQGQQSPNNLASNPEFLVDPASTGQSLIEKYECCKPNNVMNQINIALAAGKLLGQSWVCISFFHFTCTVPYNSTFAD